MLHHQTMMQLYRILRKTLHDFRSTHLGSVMLQRIILLHILFQISICMTIITHCLIILAKIAITYLAKTEVHIIQFLLMLENILDLRHIASLYGLSDANGVHIISRNVIAVGIEPWRYLIKIFLRHRHIAQVEVNIRQVELAKVHIKGFRLAMLLQKRFQDKKLSERSLIVLGIIIVTSIVVEIISLHAHRHLREVFFRLLIVLQRGIKIIELQIDGGESEIECDILLGWQFERVYKKQGTAIPCRSFRQLTLEDISITQIGTNLRQLVLGITIRQQVSYLSVKFYHLVRFLAEVMKFHCFQVVGISLKGV